jgi:MazG family protein
MDRLIEIMARLRDPDTGCPWDVEQNFATIAPYTVEEAYEVADAIARDDLADLKDELGDLLFQVVYHARMAEEAHAFAFADVVAAICDKMIRRHPHVFGEAEVADAAAQTRAWERHKEAEKAESGRRQDSDLDGIPAGMPALARAQKLGRKAARAGFDWDNVRGVLAKLEEELDELRRARAGDGIVEEEIGDILFTVVNLCRHEGVDAEGALRHANAKFERRFRQLEETVACSSRRMSDMDVRELERLWQIVKGDKTAS